MDLPVLFGPSGYQRLSHPDGELAAARASRRVGTTLVLSTSSNYSLEEVGAIAQDPWYQLYWFTDEGVTRDMIVRAAAAGTARWSLTVDAPVRIWREGEMRDPPEVPDGIVSANVPDIPLTIAPNLTWDSLAWLRAIAPEMKLVLKGILTAEDARLAAEHGVDARHRLEPRRPDAGLDDPDARRAAGGGRRGRRAARGLPGRRRPARQRRVQGARARRAGRPAGPADRVGLATGGEEGVVRYLQLVRASCGRWSGWRARRRSTRSTGRWWGGALGEEIGE